MKAQQKGPFTTGKRLTHPTWRYKTRRSYLLAKELQIHAMFKPLYKFNNGSAWCPKKVRDRMHMVEQWLDSAYKELRDFNQRQTKKK